MSAISSAERAAERSPVVQRSRMRGAQQATAIIEAARRLVAERGEQFTTQELVKEAGVALQTFYRYFEGKDQLLLAVIGDMVQEQARAFEEAARELPDPIARLHFYVTGVLKSLIDSTDRVGPRFITAEHWRLHQRFPEEMARATQPFTDLVRREVEAAAAAGLLAPTDPERDAWMVTKLAMSVYHHYAFAPTDASAEDMAEHLWSFCLTGLGSERERPGYPGP
jgi:AcrR family transcriptional regulator